MKNFISGIFIGIGAILPGISSGVFCVIFGLYEKLVYSILHFFDDIKKNITFLFPIILGTLVGIFLFSNILQFLFSNFYMVTSFSFIGLILGSLPIVINQSSIDKFSFSHIICAIFTFIISIYLIVLENKLDLFSVSFSNYSLILAGLLMSVGIVVPGVSKTSILMLLGIYPAYLSAISNIYLPILFPIGIGLLIGCILCLILIQFLFKYFKSYTYCCIIGFVLSSIFVIYPGFTFNLEGLISIIIFLLSFIISLKLC